MAEVETCSAEETHCWYLELSQPSLESVECHEVRAVGGCWSSLTNDVWSQTSASAEGESRGVCVSFRERERERERKRGSCSIKGERDVRREDDAV